MADLKIETLFANHPWAALDEQTGLLGSRSRPGYPGVREDAPGDGGPIERDLARGESTAVLVLGPFAGLHLFLHLTVREKGSGLF